MSWTPETIEINGRLIDAEFEETTLGEGKQQKTVRVYRDIDTKEIVDIQVSLTPEERYNLLRRVGHQHATPAQASLTYILQNGIADFTGEVEVRLREEAHGKGDAQLKSDIHYQQILHRKEFMEEMHALSTYFIEFEQFINHAPSSDPMESLRILSDAITKFKGNDEAGILSKIKAIKAKVNAWSTNVDAREEMNEILDALHKKIGENILFFEQRIKKLREKIPTRAEVDALFQLQAPFENATLGAFSGQCMMDILGAGIDTVHAIKEDTLWGRFKSHMWESTSGRSLSRAKREIRGKIFSLAGTEYNTNDSIPQEQIDVLTVISKRNEPSSSGNSKTKFLSLAPYVKSWSLLEADPVLCLALNYKVEARKKPGLRWDGLKWFALVPEIGIYFPLRLFGEALGFVATGLGYAAQSLTASALYWTGMYRFVPKIYQECVSHEGLLNRSNAYHQGLAKWHAKLSTFGVLGSQRAWNNQYQRLNNEGYNTFLKDSMNHPRNWCADVFEGLAPKELFPFLATQLSAIPGALGRAWGEIKENPPTIVVWGYKKVREGLVRLGWVKPLKESSQEEDFAVIERILDLQEEMFDMEKTKFKEEIANPLVDTGNKKTATIDRYVSPVLCKTTDIANPFAVPNEVMALLSKVVNDAFCEAAGPAGVGCTAATLALGTAMVPAVSVGVMKAISAGLQKPASVIATHFMGQHFSESMTAKLFSAFLEWKLFFFGTEGVKAVAENDYEFLQRVFGNPEKFVIGAIICITMGNVIGHMPLIPEPQIMGYTAEGLSLYQSMFNGLVNESKECANGTMGLRALEFGFLGLKFFMFLDSTTHGTIYKNDTAKQRAILILLNTLIKEKPFGNGREAAFATILERGAYSALTNDDKNELKKAFTAFCNKNSQPITCEETNLFSSQNHIGPERELAVAREKLEKAKNRLKKNPEAFVGNEHLGKRYFDYMDALIERYNRALCALGKDHQQIKKTEFMQEFGKQYYQGSPNILRLFYLLPPVYIGVILFRLYKSPPAWYNRLTGNTTSPYVANQVRRSYAKDLSNFLQIIGCSAVQPSFAIGRASQTILRGFVGAPIYAVLGLVSLGSPKLADKGARWVDNTILRRIHVVNFDLPGWLGLRKLCGEASAIASTSSNLVEATHILERDLNSAKDTGKEGVTNVDGYASVQFLTDGRGLTNAQTELREEANAQIRADSPYFGKSAVRFFAARLPKAPETLIELAAKEKTPVQRDTLERLARMKALENDGKKVEENWADDAVVTNNATISKKVDPQKLLRRLPTHWQSVVQKEYVDPILSTRSGSARSYY